ncbi:chemotaxis protein CheW [Scytonema sp. NUACC26]|uniref:chemotaxis protein CheW n=1 Tax=Scytonema sp. NUACC26 TaxID=3140176 RepID=UPI0034DC7252
MGESLTEGKYITFKISTYLLALPIDSVFKVIACPPDLSHTLREAKLAQLGQSTVMILKLHQSLDPLYSQQQDSNQIGRFLIIMQGKEGELYGILVGTPPNLMTIPETCIQQVPQSFHHTGLPTWVSQIAILNHKDERTTILMLDIQRSSLVDNRALSIDGGQIPDLLKKSGI